MQDNQVIKDQKIKKSFNKIAFIITSDGWGGLEMNVLKLAELLSDKGYQITLITYKKSTIYIKGKDIFSSTFLLAKIRKYFDITSAKKIGNLLKKEGISTLLAFDNRDLDVTAWTKKLFFRKLNVIYQQHMQIGIDKKGLLHTFRYSAINYWISPLQYLKNEVLIRTRFPAEKIKVIPLCLDIKKFTQKKYSRKEALEAINIIPKTPLIGIIGRISEKKGQLFLVETLIKLKNNGVDIELLIFGSPTVNDTESQDYYRKIKETIEKHKLQNVVHFVEYREDVSAFYSAVDIFVLASHSETYGMVTIEAMLSKLPIIATKSGGTSEILENGRLGLLYEYENHDEFYQRLIWILEHKTETENMAFDAYNIACKKYSQEIEVNEIDYLIQSLW